LSEQAHAETFTPELTVVIPAYNEAHRLPKTLGQVADYLQSRDSHSELLVVDDGSADDTATIAEGFSAMRQLDRGKVRMRVIRNEHRGKGYTVRTGMLAAQGRYVLFTDADLSTPIEAVEQLLPWAERGGVKHGPYPVVIGSREGVGATRYDEPAYRHLMGRIFNLLVRVMAIHKLQDTQCGFKLFSHAAAQDLFQRLELYGHQAGLVKGAMVTGFDVEVLYIAQKRGYRIREVPVEWRHYEGSKVNPLKDSLRMFRDILKVRLNDLQGKYD
jgi:glycosyltransferase involved in cell wall biosynthesis